MYNKVCSVERTELGMIALLIRVIRIKVTE